MTKIESKRPTYRDGNTHRHRHTEKYPRNIHIKRCAALPPRKRGTERLRLKDKHIRSRDYKETE